MPKIIYEYKILKAENHKELAAEVDSHIDLGWQPYGSLVIDGGPSYAVFYQPVVKKEDE